MNSSEPRMHGHFIVSGILQSDTSWDGTVLGTRERALFSALQQTTWAWPQRSCFICL